MAINVWFVGAKGAAGAVIKSIPASTPTGINSSAPISGVTKSLASPSISVVTEAIGVPALFKLVLFTSKVVFDVNNGSLKIELASKPLVACQSAKVVWTEPK